MRIKLAVPCMLLLITLPTPVLADPPSFILSWGTSGAGAGQFNEPTGIAVNLAGTAVYVVDKDNFRVQKFNPTGGYITAWSFGTAPYAADLDAAGNLYVADYLANRVTKYDGNGTFLMQWGSTGSGPGQFSSPFGIAVSADGFVYVCDSNNARIQKFNTFGGYMDTWGTAGTGNGQFDRPHGIDTDSDGNVFVLDIDRGRVQKFTSAGAYVTQWGSNGTGPGEFNLPRDLTVDVNGSVHVADFGNDRIQQFTNSGNFVMTWGVTGTGNGQLDGPMSIDIDASGFIYVADFYNDRIQKFHYDLPIVDVGRAPPAASIPQISVLPNPFRTIAEIRFVLPHAGRAQVSLYDVAGGRVRSLAHRHLPPGHHALSWDGRDDAGRRVSPGIYLARLAAGDRSAVARVLLIE